MEQFSWTNKSFRSMGPRWRHHVDTNTILFLSLLGKQFFYFQFPFHRFLLHLKKIPNFESIVRTRVLNSHPAIDTFQLCGVGKSVKCHWNPFQKVTSTQSQRVELGSVTQVPVIRREKTTKESSSRTYVEPVSMMISCLLLLLRRFSY